MALVGPFIILAYFHSFPPTQPAKIPTKVPTNPSTRPGELLPDGRSLSEAGVRTHTKKIKNNMAEISYDDFAKLDIRVGTIRVCERVNGSEKLYRLEVDFGPTPPNGSDGANPTPPNGSDGANPTPPEGSDEARSETRQILSGIQKFYTPEQLIGRQAMFVVNLAPRQMMGLTSNGMLVAAHGLPAQAGEGGSAVLYLFDKPVPNGSKIS